MAYNDLVYRPGVEKKNRRRYKRGKALLPNLPKSQYDPEDFQRPAPRGPKGKIKPNFPGKVTGGIGRASQGGAGGGTGGGTGGGGSKKKKGGGGPSLGDFIDPLTRKRFNREMRATENLEFAPIQHQINRELAASQFRSGKELPAWYAAARADIQKIEGQSGQEREALLNRLQGAMGEAGTQDAANRTAMMERLSKDAQLRGVALDPSIESGQVNAEAARRNSTLNTLGTLGGQSANQADYLRNRRVNTFQQEREATGREGAREQQILADLRELARKRGDFRTKYRADTRSAEREFYLGRKALGSKNKYSDAIVKQAQLGQHKTVDVNNSYTGLPKPGKPGGSSSGGSSSGYSTREAIGLGRQQMRKKAGFPHSRAQFIDYLTNRGVDSKVAKKAANRLGIK